MTVSYNYHTLSFGIFKEATHSQVTISSSTHSSLPPEPNTARMIRLLPNDDKDAQIKCEFPKYKLSEKGGGKTFMRHIPMYGTMIKRAVLKNANESSWIVDLSILHQASMQHF